MSAVLLVLQFVLSIVLTGLILIQRSEGGALGIGGGGGGLMSGRSATDNIVKATTAVGVIFVLNCVALTVVFNMERRDASILEVDGLAIEAKPDVPPLGDILGTTTPDATPLTPMLDPDGAAAAETPRAAPSVTPETSPDPDE